jgi:ribosomal protein S8
MAEKKNEFEPELVAVFKKTGHVFGYERQTVKEDGKSSFFLYRLITHSGVAHTNWVSKEAMRNYLQAKAS